MGDVYTAGLSAGGCDTRTCRRDTEAAVRLVQSLLGNSPTALSYEGLRILPTVDSIEARYYSRVIRSFADKETERIAHGQRSRKFPAAIQPRARQCLERLGSVRHPEDLRFFPAMRVKRLRGPRRGQYSIRVNDQYRIVFTWRDASADDVQLLDYH